MQSPDPLIGSTEQVASLCSLITLVRAAQIDRETETLGILTVPRRLAVLPTVGFQEILLVPIINFLLVNVGLFFL